MAPIVERLGGANKERLSVLHGTFLNVPESLEMAGNALQRIATFSFREPKDASSNSLFLLEEFMAGGTRIRT
jgi:hypothetical protein